MVPPASTVQRRRTTGQNLEANLLDLLERIKSGAVMRRRCGGHIYPRRMDRDGPSAFRPSRIVSLSNIFLHHVLDEWFESEVNPRLKGKSTLV